MEPSISWLRPGSSQECSLEPHSFLSVGLLQAGSYCDGVALSPSLQVLGVYARSWEIYILQPLSFEHCVDFFSLPTLSDKLFLLK